MNNTSAETCKLHLPRLSSGSTSGGRCSIRRGVKLELKMEGEGVSGKATPGMASLCLMTSSTVARTLLLLER